MVYGNKLLVYIVYLSIPDTENIEINQIYKTFCLIGACIQIWALKSLGLTYIQCYSEYISKFHLTTMWDKNCVDFWHHKFLITLKITINFPIFMWSWINCLPHVAQSVSSVAQLSPTFCNPMDCSTPGLPVHHQLAQFTQTHTHWVGDAIQPSHPLLSPSPPAFNLSQHQGLFQWVSSLHQVAKVLEFQLQHQSLQWIFRTDFL